MHGKRVSRREFLKTAGVVGATLATGTLSNYTFGAPATPSAPRVPSPWAYTPRAPKPKKIVYIRAMWQDVFDPLAKQFERDWGVPVEILYETNNEEGEAKGITMATTGSQVDSVFLVGTVGAYIAADLILPINKMPGYEAYVNDFTEVTKSTLEYGNGLYWGLPQDEVHMVMLLNRAKLEKAGVRKPYTTWEEMVDQCLKAKKDGVAKYPHLWVGGLGAEQLPGTFFSLVWNRGGVIFDKDGRPAFGPGSVARETLKWWAKTFLEWEISDPLSLEVRFIPAAKAFGTGDYLYMGLQHHGIAFTQQDPTQYPAAATTEFMMMPGNGGTLGLAHGNCITRAAGEQEWAWKWLQYIGGRTKDGTFMAMHNWAEKLGNVPPYRSQVRSAEFLNIVRGKSKTLDVLFRQGQRASGWKRAVPVMNEIWYPKWLDMMNTKLQECLRGKITADQACVQIMAAADQAKKIR